MIVFLLLFSKYPFLFCACPCITRKEKKKDISNTVNLIYNLLKSKRESSERKWGRVRQKGKREMEREEKKEGRQIKREGEDERERGRGSERRKKK